MLLASDFRVAKAKRLQLPAVFEVTNQLRLEGRHLGGTGLLPHDMRTDLDGEMLAKRRADTLAGMDVAAFSDVKLRSNTGRSALLVRRTPGKLVGEAAGGAGKQQGREKAAWAHSSPSARPISYWKSFGLVTDGTRH